MAITINGSGTITGVSAGGLPDGCVDNDTIANSTIANTKLVNDSVTVNGTSIDLGASQTITAGKILQVVQTQKTDTTSVAGDTNGTQTVFKDTGLSLSITPSSTNSKILLMSNMNINVNATGEHTYYRFLRNGSAIGIGDASGSRTRCTAADVSYGGNGRMNMHYISWTDSPSTTSAITYKIQVTCNNNGQSIYINRNAGGDGSYFYRARTVSTLVAMEISGD